MFLLIRHTLIWKETNFINFKFVRLIMVSSSTTPTGQRYIQFGLIIFVWCIYFRRPHDFNNVWTKINNVYWKYFLSWISYENPLCSIIVIVSILISVGLKHYHFHMPVKLQDFSLITQKTIIVTPCLVD